MQILNNSKEIILGDNHDVMNYYFHDEYVSAYFYTRIKDKTLKIDFEFDVNLMVSSPKELYDEIIRNYTSMLEVRAIINF